MESFEFFLADITFQVTNFMILGGDVLLLIAAAIFIMWGFIVERALFFYVRYPGKARRIRNLSAGMGNPRLMADGVAKATVPTMAGMVGALSGVFAIYWLEWQAKSRMEHLADHLVTEHSDEVPA